MGWPIPTRRAFFLLAAGLVPALAAALSSSFGVLVLALDLAVLGLVALDFALAPRGDALTVKRACEAIVSSGRVVPVTLTLELTTRAPRLVRGELRDQLSGTPLIEGARQRFALTSRTDVHWRFTSAQRGDLTFGAVWLRLDGPLGLCARQVKVPLPGAIKVYPDLVALTTDALALARSSDDRARRVIPLRAEGREFESLREYRVGDDRRTIDWKATARRAKPMVRVHQPERNQQVLILLDCGRHMAGEAGGRQKLDHAVDATLRLAKVSLDQGDQVGVIAFGAKVLAALPARKGQDHLRAIVQALYRVEATLDESDFGQAIDFAFARSSRRSLVVVLTDVLDAESSAALVRRTARLVPRHLPLIISLRDAGVQQLAHAWPSGEAEARTRLIATRLEAELTATVATLREAGARVVRADAAAFGAASVAAYLEIKNRGLL